MRVVNVIEEYTMFLGRVDKLVDQRQSVTSIYLTVYTAIVGAIGLAIVDTPNPKWQRQIAVLLLFGGGHCRL